MDITKLIASQQDCLSRELKSYTFKSSDNHWYWRESEPDEHGENYVNVFDYQNNKLLKISVRILHAVLVNRYDSFEHDLKMRSQCPHIHCVNPDHNEIILALPGSTFTRSEEDWTLPFGWK